MSTRDAEGMPPATRTSPSGGDQPGVQVPQHVPLVPVEQHRAGLAPVPHLRVLHADPPVFGNPRRSAGARPVRSMSWSRTCRAVVPAAAAASSPACPATNASTRSSGPSTSASASSRAAGSSQSASSPPSSWRLPAAAPWPGWPSRRSRRPGPHPCAVAITPRALTRACRIKLKVSSTRPAPHKGLESSAARSARAPNPPVRAASSTVCSTSRRSRFLSTSRLRNPTRVPLKTVAPPRSCSPGPAASAGPSPSPRSPHHRRPGTGL